MDAPEYVETAAVDTLAGVGGDHEWWIYRPARVGHLRVPVTEEEYALVPQGVVVGDAGESGPLRARTAKNDIGQWFLDGPDVTPPTRGPAPSQSAVPRRPAQPRPVPRAAWRGSSSGAGRATPGVQLRRRPYDYEREVDHDA